MKSNSSFDWAHIVDLFASEYGWSLHDICELNLCQVKILIQAIQKRYDKQNDQESGDSSSCGGSEELSIADFETKLGGKSHVREDGIKEIII